MPQTNSYESFRNVLTMNLCSILSADQVGKVLEAVDLAMGDYDIVRKPVEIICQGGIPEIVKVFIASKAVANVSKGTLAQYNYKLQHFFSAVRKSYTDISPNDIRMYLYQFRQERNASDRYLESIRITLHGFFGWIVDNGYLTCNPCAKVEKIRFQEKRREPLSNYELEYLRWNSKSIREKALIDFLFSTGVRISECADVRLSDINWENRSVLIRHGKGDKQRTVYFNAESELTLREYLKTRTDDTDALFVSNRSPHQPLQNHALENIISSVAERAGMHVFPHRLRHTFATSGLRGGMSLETLQALMGHVKPETTLIYAKLNQQDLQMAHQRVYT